MEKEKYKLAKKFLEDSGIGVDQKNLHLFVSDLDFYEKVNKRWESTSKEKKELLLKRFEMALSLPLLDGYQEFVIQLDETEDGSVELTEEETKILIYIYFSFFWYASLSWGCVYVFYIAYSIQNRGSFFRRIFYSGSSSLLNYINLISEYWSQIFFYFFWLWGRKLYTWISLFFIFFLNLWNLAIL